MIVVSLVPSEIVDIKPARKRKREKFSSGIEETGANCKRRNIESSSRRKAKDVAESFFSKEPVIGSSTTKDKRVNFLIDVPVGEGNHESVCHLGRIRFSDQSIYEGEIKDGVPDGYGMRTCPDGSVYKGHFEKGQPEGFGTLVDFDEIEYRGEFVKGYAHGCGVMTCPDKTTYEGKFVKGLAHGQGVLTYFDGSNYQGDFVKGVFEGKGVLSVSNGESYKGDFVNDKGEGWGRYDYSNGCSYEGESVNGKREGKGRYIDADGDSYEGDWVSNARQGKGRYICVDGASYENDWKNDQIVGTNINQLGDELFYDLLCGSHQRSPPDGYCLGIVRDYLQKKGYEEIAHSLAEAERCSLLAEEEAEQESNVIFSELHNRKTSRLICYGSKDHAMGLNLISGAIDGFIVCEIFNSGTGLVKYHERHPSNKKKYKLMLQVKVPVKRLTSELIYTLLRSQSLDQPINTVYGRLLDLPGAKILPSVSSPWKKPQKGNDCSLQWIYKAYLGEKMSDVGQGRRQMKEDCKSARMKKMDGLS